MMGCQDQYVIIIGQAEQSRSQQWPHREIERAPGFLVDQTCGLSLALSMISAMKVDLRNQELVRRCRDLNRLAIDN